MHVWNYPGSMTLYFRSEFARGLTILVVMAQPLQLQKGIVKQVECITSYLCPIISADQSQPLCRARVPASLR